MIIPHSKINTYKANLAQSSNTFFTGSYNTQRKNMNWDPFITGYAFILWFNVPTWMNTLFGENTFKKMTEKNFKSFSGLSDIELGTAAVTQGFTGNELHFASGIQKQNTEFTLKHQEYSGSPVRNLYQAWVTGIRDPETGIATYPKMFGLDYAAKNHTAEMLYVVTRPDANNVSKKNIEFAAYYTNVMPKRIPLGHLNHETGSHDQVEIEIPFSGDLHMSAKVDEFAEAKLKETYAFEVMGNFSPDQLSSSLTNLQNDDFGALSKTYTGTTGGAN